MVVGADLEHLHFDGCARPNRASLLDTLAAITRVYDGEVGRTIAALPPENAAKQVRGVVAFRLRLTRVQSKTKLSQNRDEENVSER
jgi:predicted FMN-binding regulatory protein PaiB